MTDGLGERWELDRCTSSPIRQPLHARRHRRRAHGTRAGIAPGDVEAVEVGLPAPVLRTVAQPAEVKAAPPTGYAARFSAPFAFAAALSGGGGLGLSLADFRDERATDPALRALAARVRCVANAECDDIFPHHFPRS